MRAILAIAVAAASAALAGCGDGAEQRGGVTAEEARELDEAAEMLDTSPDSLVASNEMELGNLEEPTSEVPAAAPGEDAILNNGAVPPAQ